MVSWSRLWDTMETHEHIDCSLRLTKPKAMVKTVRDASQSGLVTKSYQAAVVNAPKWKNRTKTRTNFLHHKP